MLTRETRLYQFNKQTLNIKLFDDQENTTLHAK